MYNVRHLLCTSNKRNEMRMRIASGLREFPQADLLIGRSTRYSSHSELSVARCLLSSEGSGRQYLAAIKITFDRNLRTKLGI